MTPWRRTRRWLLASLIIFRWPVSPAVLFAMVAATNPPPYLFPTVGGTPQSVVFAGAALACAFGAVWPRHMWARNLMVLGSTWACAWRVLTLSVNPERYTLTEVVAFSAVWVTVGLLVIEMTILTWPSVSEDHGH